MKQKHNPKLCRKCGKCCYIKTIVCGIHLFTKQHCEYLDEETNLCIVYKNRFKKKPQCLTVEQAIQIRALPNDCPYVKNLKNYEGPIWDETPKKQENEK